MMTGDNLGPEANVEAELTSLRSQLAAYRGVCERLWPAVRFFLLGGADPRYVEAVVDLGELLGKTQAGGPVDREATVKVRLETVEAVAHWVRNSLEVRGVCGGSGREEIAKLIERNLKR